MSKNAFRTLQRLVSDGYSSEEEHGCEEHGCEECEYEDEIDEILCNKSYNTVKKYIIVWGGPDHGEDIVFFCKSEQQMVDRLFDFLENSDMEHDELKKIAVMDIDDIIEAVLEFGREFYNASHDGYIANVISIDGTSKIFGPFS